MQEKTVALAAQYTKEVSFVALQRPYAVREAVSNSVEMALDIEKLPEEDHWRVELTVQVIGSTEQGLPCFTAQASVEGIAVARVPEEEVDQVLRYTIAASLFGTCRVLLTQASANTGYGPLVLPPVQAQQIAQLPPSGGQTTESE